MRQARLLPGGGGTGGCKTQRAGQTLPSGSLPTLVNPTRAFCFPVTQVTFSESARPVETTRVEAEGRSTSKADGLKGREVVSSCRLTVMGEGAPSGIL